MRSPSMRSVTKSVPVRICPYCQDGNQKQQPANTFTVTRFKESEFSNFKMAARQDKYITVKNLVPFSQKYDRNPKPSDPASSM